MKERLQAIKKTFFPWPFITIVILFALDQWSKVWTMAQEHPNPFHIISRPIDGWLHLVDIRNPGAAWGAFGEHTNILALISLAAFLYLLYDFAELIEDSRFKCFTYTLLMGGIIGNWWDRQFREGGVVDMVQVFIPMPKFTHSWFPLHTIDELTGRYSFPAFNIADACICIAVTFFIYITLATTEKEIKERRENAQNNA